jgi:hypothetical protein
MLHPNNLQWWILVVCAVLIVTAWPPRDGKSLGAKFVNWAVDPGNELPTLPDQLALGAGDDPDAVNARDMQVQQYDALYLQGGWTRKRLELKVAGDPFDPATERQLLTVFGVVVALLAWRLGARRSRGRG